MSLEMWAILFVGLVAVSALGSSYWRPHTLRQDYERTIQNLRTDLAELRKRLDDSEVKNQRLQVQLYKMQGLNQWLRNQLRLHGVEIPPVPEDLRDTELESAGIQIVIDQTRGINIKGGTTDIHGDAVGGDKK